VTPVNRLHFFAAALFVALTANQARAALILTFQGQTYQNSSLAGASIASGTAFTVEVGFPDTYSTLNSGVPYFSVDSIQVEVDGTPYTPIFGPDDYQVVLSDPSTFAGGFIVGFGPSGLSSGFAPAYTAATTPGWSALAPTPTQFAYYLGTWFPPLLQFNTSAGALDLDFDKNQVGSFTAVITGDTATPEPSAVLLGLTGLAGLVLARRLRR
jgi:hypothetical protein